MNNYYAGFLEQHGEPEFEVEILFDGKTQCFRQGYRPNFNYPGEVEGWDAFYRLDRDGWIEPGSTVRAVLWTLSPSVHYARIRPGMDLEFREGQMYVGRGRVTRLIGYGRPGYVPPNRGVPGPEPSAPSEERW
jgi:hypothetical protein